MSNRWVLYIYIFLKSVQRSVILGQRHFWSSGQTTFSLKGCEKKKWTNVYTQISSKVFRSQVLEIRRPKNGDITKVQVVLKVPLTEINHLELVIKHKNKNRDVRGPVSPTTGKTWTGKLLRNPLDSHRNVLEQNNLSPPAREAFLRGLLVEDCVTAGQLPGVNVCKCIKVKRGRSQRKKKTACMLSEPYWDKWRLEKSI